MTYTVELETPNGTVIAYVDHDPVRDLYSIAVAGEILRAGDELLISALLAKAAS